MRQHENHRQPRINLRLGLHLLFLLLRLGSCFYVGGEMRKSVYQVYKSCPFCGGRNSKGAEKIQAHSNIVPTAWVSCSFCFAVGPLATTKPEAILKWNDRPYTRYAKPLSDREEAIIDEAIHK